jgi:hypothetical protein
MESDNWLVFLSWKVDCMTTTMTTIKHMHTIATDQFIPLPPLAAVGGWFVAIIVTWSLIYVSRWWQKCMTMSRSVGSLWNMGRAIVSETPSKIFNVRACLFIPSNDIVAQLFYLLSIMVPPSILPSVVTWYYLQKPKTLRPIWLWVRLDGP